MKDRLLVPAIRYKSQEETKYWVYSSESERDIAYPEILASHYENNTDEFLSKVILKCIVQEAIEQLELDIVLET